MRCTFHKSLEYSLFYPLKIPDIYWTDGYRNLQGYETRLVQSLDVSSCDYTFHELPLDTSQLNDSGL